MKELAKFWYYSHHPNDCELLTRDEKIWVDKLNRVGISYFRPLVTVALSKGIAAEKRVRLFKAIERFIFVCFRLGMFQSSYQNHIYYNKASELFETSNEAIVDDVINNLNNKTDAAMQEALDKFKARMIRSYKQEDGFYDWKNLKYFLYEAEFEKYLKSGIERLVAEDYFLKGEKDKFSIEHVYPQTPNEWYWRNTYRNFTDEEKRSLTNSLGNLLPLSRSVNSSLQNHIFDKKKERYSRGSHSEAEVAGNRDWTAKEIYERGMRLLEFMNDRWALGLNRTFLAETLNIEFVNDGRDEKPEITYSEIIEKKPRTEEERYRKSDRITVEQYLQDKKENMTSLFGSLKAEILETCLDAEEYVIPRYVAYKKNGKNFVEVQVQGSNIMTLSLAPDVSEDLVGKKIPDGYKWTLNYRCYLKTEEDIPDVMKVIKHSYEKR